MTRARRALSLVALTVVLRAASLFVPLFNSDEAYIATQAHVLVHGGRLYVDTADRKPPLVPVIYAAVFGLVGSDSLFAVHVLAILVVAATAMTVAAVARRHVGDEASRLAPFVYLCASASFLPADTLAANFEIFMLLPACAALLSAGRGRMDADALAGVLVGVATLCKQTAAITAVPVLISILMSAGWRRGVLGFGVGLFAPLALACRFYGTHELAFWTCSSLSTYLFDERVVFYALVRGALVTAGFAACTAAVWWLVSRSCERSRADVVLWSWLATSFVAVCVGHRFFGHYYLQLLPPAAVLASRAFDVLPSRLRLRVIVALVVPALVGALAGFVSPSIHRMPRYEATAAFVRAHMTAHETIAIWGHLPELYWAAGRSPATRLVHTGFLTGVSGGRPVDVAMPLAAGPELWSLYLCELRAAPPRYFVDTSTAAIRDYERHPISAYPALAAWLASGYRLSTTIDGITLYERTTAVATGERCSL